MNAFKKHIALSEYPKLATYLIKWLGMALGAGILVGSASALLLVSLFWATDTREAHQEIIWLLPIGGLLIGLLYHYWGKDVVKGNNQLIETIKRICPPNSVLVIKTLEPITNNANMANDAKIGFTPKSLSFRTCLVN
jgi:H+/Cl- antiporter ClcA